MIRRPLPQPNSDGAILRKYNRHDFVDQYHSACGSAECTVELQTQLTAPHHSLLEDTNLACGVISGFGADRDFHVSAELGQESEQSLGRKAG